jgi:choline-sulfatase
VAAFGKTHYYWPRPHEFDICVDWPDYQAWLSNKSRFSSNGDVLGPWRPFCDPASVWLNSAALPYAAFDANMFGTFLATQAVQYLAMQKARPFFLYVSFYETHSPFWFPVEFRGRHSPRSFQVPRIGPEDYNCQPAVFRELSEVDKQGVMAAYATSAEFLDKNVGLVLAALDSSAHANNTLVIFTSDHGYMLGQHGRFEKHCCFEPAVRAALLMRFPSLIRPGRATSALVELIDLAPTILELCGVAVPANLHGRSLTALLRGQTAAHREWVTAEYADNEEAMIRTDRWKLIYSTGARRRRDGYALDPPAAEPLVRLYDLENDPEETTNLADHTEYAGRVEQLINQLADHLVHTAREPRLIPKSQDIRLILAHCLSPRDIDVNTYIRDAVRAAR